MENNTCFNINSSLNEIYNNIETKNIPIDNNCIYTAHEGLLLNYEECFVKKCENEKYYDLSSHILWIGS